MAALRLAFFLIIFTLGIQIAHFQKRKVLNTGDACKLASKKKGICRPLPDCQSALNDLSSLQKWPLFCRNVGSTSIVCCDESKVSTSPNDPSGIPYEPPNISNGPPSQQTGTTWTPKTTLSTTTRATTTTRSKPTKGSTENYPGLISRKKCKEYSRWRPGPPILFPGAVGAGEDNRQPGKCGVSVATFIVGGEEAKALEFPHMAHLGFGDNYDELAWSCGGSLISERFVLTAGHCLRKKDGTNITNVRLGSSDKRSIQIVKVEEVIPHPDYNSSSYYNDIALLRLAQDVKFTDYKRPACVQASKRINHKLGTASGWGTTENSTSSKVLLKVDLPFMGWEECIKTYKANINKLSRGIDDNIQLCAGALDLKKDTCQGDSGGPLQIVLKSPDPECMYSIVGITSFGIRCGIAPGVYTRVSAYVDWIERTVWPNETAD